MAPFDSFFGKFLSRTFIAVEDGCKAGIPLDRRKKEFGRYRENPVGSVKWLQNKKREIVLNNSKEIIYVFLTIFLYLLKCPQSLIL